MISPLYNVLTLVGLGLKRLSRQRLLIILPVLTAILLGLACRFNRSSIPSGLLLVGVVTGFTVARQRWIDRATHFSDCVDATGADQRMQATAAIVVWIIVAGGLSALLLLLAAV